MVKQSSRARQKRAGPARKDRWLRWVAAGLATAVVVAFSGLFVFIHFLAGRGSLAGGYRVREEFLGPGNTMAGRTSAVPGRVVIAHAVVTSASFRVDLAAVTVNGKAQPQLAKILDTARFPDATFTLTKPVTAGSGLVMNKSSRVQATGLLTMHGITRPVTFQATARYSGTLLEAAGSIPVLFSDWNIHAPEFLQNHGLLEFLLVLRH